jgi:hypothetical protein
MEVGMLPDRLAGILTPLLYRPTGAVLGTSYVQYLIGLRDAGIEGAADLIARVQRYQQVRLTFAEGCNHENS